MLEALGLGVELGPSDVAVRGNFATVRYEGDVPVVTDRRAGRLKTEENRRVISRISSAVEEIAGVKVSFYPVLSTGSSRSSPFPTGFRNQTRLSATQIPRQKAQLLSDLGGKTRVPRRRPKLPRAD